MANEAADPWEAYFYPETLNPATGNGTLRNLFGERDPRMLRILEYSSAADRQAELASGATVIAHTYDSGHVRAIHRHLFGDVYAWAGEYRTVDMFKGNGREFASVETGEIDRYLVDVHRLVENTPWAELGRDDVARAAADVFAHLNQAHPFREGNGRTSKVFMEHVAQCSDFTFVFTRVSPLEWNTGSELSRPDFDQYRVYPDAMLPVFRAVTVPRPPALPRTSTSTATGSPTLEQTPQAGRERSPRARRRQRARRCCANSSTASAAQPAAAGRAPATDPATDPGRDPGREGEGSDQRRGVRAGVAP